MKMLRFLISIRFLYFWGCLVLIQTTILLDVNAQSVSIPTSQPAASPVIPSLPATAITANPLGITSSDTSKKAVTLYSEFKSICNHDEEFTPGLTPELKIKRIELLEKKLESALKTDKKDNAQVLKVLLIKEHLKQNNLSKAESLYFQSTAQLSESDKSVITAEIDIQKKLVRQARNNLNKYLEKNPKDIAALEKLAEIYTSLNNYLDAKIIYEDLSKINISKKYTEDLCKNSAANADHLNTKIYCEKLFKENTNSYLAHIYIGISFRDQEYYDDAVKNFTKSLLVKKTEFASTCLAESFYLKKDYTKAIENYEASILIKPDSKRAYLGLANAYVKKNMYDVALGQFKASCKLGLSPISEMSEVANLLKSQKSDQANLYLEEIQKCKK